MNEQAGFNFHIKRVVFTRSSSKKIKIRSLQKILKVTLKKY